MTNKDRLISLLGFAPDNNAVEGALLDAGITMAGAYDGSNSVEIKKCAVGLMEVLLTTANTTSNNGATSTSISFDRNAVLKRLQMYKKELGITDGTVPTIKDVSYMW